MFRSGELFSLLRHRRKPQLVKKIPQNRMTHPHFHTQGQIPLQNYSAWAQPTLQKLTNLNDELFFKDFGKIEYGVKVFDCVGLL